MEESEYLDAGASVLAKQGWIFQQRLQHNPDAVVAIFLRPCHGMRVAAKVWQTQNNLLRQILHNDLHPAHPLVFTQR
jgi:hypothetical protein